MQNLLVPGCAPWLQTILVLGVGIAVILALAFGATRRVKSAVWQRLIWRTAVVGILFLALSEAIGTGDAAVSCLRTMLSHGAANEPLASAEDNGTASQPQLPAEPTLHNPSFYTGATEPLPIAHELSSDTIAGFAPKTLYILEHPSAGAPATPASNSSPEGTPAHHAIDSTETVKESPPAWWPGAVWVCGIAVCLARIAWARLLLARFRRKAIVSRDGLRQRVNRLAANMGLRRRVAVMEAAGLHVPVAFGLLRPTIVLPPTFSTDFDDRQQQAILAHEIAHLAACDPLWQLAADVLCSILWWHPLVWWLRGRLRAASEAAADEASLLVPDGPDVLAVCLVALGRKLAGARRLGWLSIEGPGFRSGLGRRVERLLALQAEGRRAPAPFRLAIARIAFPLALVFVSVFSTAWARPQALISQGETTMSRFRVSWQRSLAAMALAAWLGPATPDAAADNPKPPEHASAHAEQSAEGAARVGPHAAPQLENPTVIYFPAPHLEIQAIDPKFQELLDKRTKLEAETREIERRLGELPDDKEKEAKELFAKMRKIQRAINEISKKLPPGFGQGATFQVRTAPAPDGSFHNAQATAFAHVRPMPGAPGTYAARIGGGGITVHEQAQLHKKLGDLTKEIELLTKDGKKEELDRAAKELAEVQKRLAVAWPVFAPPPPHTVAVFPSSTVNRVEPQQLKAEYERLRATVAATLAKQPSYNTNEVLEMRRKAAAMQAAAQSLVNAGVLDQAVRLLREAEALLAVNQVTVGVTLDSGITGTATMMVPPGAPNAASGYGVGIATGMGGMMKGPVGGGAGSAANVPGGMMPGIVGSARAAPGAPPMGMSGGASSGQAMPGMPGMSPAAGMAHPGGAPADASKEIREQLRAIEKERQQIRDLQQQMQKQMEEMRQMLKSMKPDKSSPAVPDGREKF